MREIYRLMWAKTNPFMSLRIHALCTGICARKMLTAPSSSSILRFLSDCFRCDEQTTVRQIAYIVSLHDIGKIHPQFQQMSAEYKELQEQAIPDLFRNEGIANRQEHFRHEYYSAEVMKRIWDQAGIDEDACDLFAAVISLHHQKPEPAHNGVRPRHPYWKEAQNQLEAEMRAFFLKDDPLLVPENTDAACILIAAILILSDWMASSELFKDAETLSTESIEQLAEKAAALYGLISDERFPPISSFDALFPEITHPRPLQTGCAQLSSDAVCTIIEAPMGEGKTEAAFFLASQLCKAFGKRGIYMALPSQATSNQMYTRMNQVLGQLGCDASRLLHGTAFLWEKLPAGFATEDEMIAAKWTRPSRMGLLSANAVGTVDQAMASVLRSRFSLIRLAGLANKVLIIDEIHAYDMYMSQIIETLLHWCCAMNIPVILLSATLQDEQKRRYLSCFGANVTLSTEYPLLTQVLPDRKTIQVPVSPASRYSYDFEPVRPDDDGQEITRAALHAIENGGCIAVLVNTVKKAQQMFQTLRASAADDIELLLFHSRFTVGQRMEIEKKCVSMFGKDRSNRPKKAILVATQVVEQSIDLDFDGMISELAPIDLLLQRAGRLHRHRQYDRPAGFERPVFTVTLPGVSAPQELKYRYGASGLVYDPFLLYNTEQELSNALTVDIPDSIRPLINSVYSKITEENRMAWTEHSMKGLLETAQAKGCTWPSPEADSFFPLDQGVCFDVSDHEDGFSDSAEASTRLGDSSIRIAFCDENLFDQLDEERLSPQMIRTLYMNSLSVRLKESILKDSPNATLIRKGKLAGVWMVRGLNRIELTAGVLTNDPMLGIIWEETQ